MKLVVGLGNPEKKYEFTRHNCGFRAIDYYASKNNLSFKSKFNGHYAETIVNNTKLILLKPQTYMNLSGESVIKFVNYYFEVGKFKLRRGGSSGGHNGINNIIDLLKTQNISRLRMGISKNNIPLMDYVLGKFSSEENEKIESILPVISNIINDFSVHNIDELMEKYNRNE